MRFGERTRSGQQVSGFNRRPSTGEVAWGVATGGSASVDREINGLNYRILTFTATGNLTIVKAGTFEFLMFGGGGGGTGGNGYNGVGRGGGGGGVNTFLKELSATTNITIGAGGGAETSGDTTFLGNGSTLGDFYAPGGGAGSQKGGCGGGGSTAILAGVTGNNGGTHGGGGVGAVGATNNGGAGYDVSVFIGGTSLFKGAGGGSEAGSGGSSIGGNGAFYPTAGGAAAANTASGGGGAGGSGQPTLFTGTGGGGGSGIVYVRFRI